MGGLTAIDVLIQPDEPTREFARAMNGRLRQAMPEGFALDSSHAPHVTLLQRYVPETELEQVLDAVGSIVAGEDLASLELRAGGVEHAEWDAPGVGMISLMLDPDARLTTLQGRLMAVVAPFAEPGGTAAAFFTDPGDPGVNATTVLYVERFVPEQIGPGYGPHVTFGMGRLGDLEAMAAEPFEPFAVRVDAVAVYQLGDNGTARRRLRAWTVGGQA